MDYMKVKIRVEVWKIDAGASIPGARVAFHGLQYGAQIPHKGRAVRV